MKGGFVIHENDKADVLNCAVIHGSARTVEKHLALREEIGPSAICS